MMSMTATRRSRPVLARRCQRDDRSSALDLGDPQRCDQSDHGGGLRQVRKVKGMGLLRRGARLRFVRAGSSVESELGMGECPGGDDAPQRVDEDAGVVVVVEHKL